MKNLNKFWWMLLLGAFMVGCDEPEELNPETEQEQEDVTPEGDGEEGDEQEEEVLTYEDFGTYFMYHGVKYPYAKFGDNEWMTTNLSYLPQGFTPSADPAEWSDIWYPYGYDEELALQVLTDSLSIVNKGYLYSIKAVFGETITEDNCYDFEGEQGICPEGWYVPTHADYFALVGASSATIDGAVANDDSALFWAASGYNTTASASVLKANEEGFNWIFTGARLVSGFEEYSVEQGVKANNLCYQATQITSSNCSVEEYYGNQALSYYMTSTAYMPNYISTESSDWYGRWYNTQFFACMTTFVNNLYQNGRLSLAHASVDSGLPLRCVRKAE